MALPSSQGTLGPNTVRASFRSPRLQLGFGRLLRSLLAPLFPGLVTRIARLLKALDVAVDAGPPSSVVLGVCLGLFCVVCCCVVLCSIVCCSVLLCVICVLLCFFNIIVYCCVLLCVVL